jgi:hypothetical protein
MLRLGCLIAGLALAGWGAGLARQELALMGARQVARITKPVRLDAAMPRLREAYNALDAANAGGTNQLDLAINLHGLGESLGERPSEAGGRESLIVRHARVERAAEKLARSSPLDARAWCVLALAHSKATGVTPAVIEQLRACYALGAREIGIIDGRLMLVWSAWDQLPQDVRNAAMIDVAAALEDPALAPWMAARLGYAVATVAPSRAQLAETLLDTYGEQQRATYAKAVDRYQRAAATRTATR